MGEGASPSHKVTVAFSSALPAVEWGVGTIEIFSTGLSSSSRKFYSVWAEARRALASGTSSSFQFPEEGTGAGWSQAIVTLDSATGTERKESAHLLILAVYRLRPLYCLCRDTHPKLPGLTTRPSGRRRLTSTHIFTHKSKNSVTSSAPVKSQATHNAV